MRVKCIGKTELNKTYHKYEFYISPTTFKTLKLLFIIPIKLYNKLIVFNHNNLEDLELYDKLKFINQEHFKKGIEAE